MAPRKMYKSKKSARKWKARKSKVTYPDRHNWKLESGANVIYNTTGGVTAAGLNIAIGKAVAQRQSFSQFGGVFNFNLNTAVSSAGFLLANFDRYKINGIKVRVIPENNFSGVGGGGTLPVMKVCYDYDDAAIPTVGDIEVRRGKNYRLDKPFTISLKPKVNAQIQNTAGVTANAPRSAPWINMGSPLVPHYGIKFAVKDWYTTQGNPPNDLQVRFIITYMISVKEQLAVNRAPSLVESYDVSGNEIPDTAPEADQCELGPVRP